MSDDVELKRMKARTKRSLGYVSLRSIVIYFFQSASVLVLSYWLVPADYGIYAILNSFVGLSWFFCDIGIGGALIKQTEAPTRDQLEACSSVQLGLASVIALLFFFAAPAIAGKYDLDHSAVWMIRVLGLSVPIYAIRGVPRLVWERDMAFEKIVRAEVGETFTMYLVQIVAAASGLGVWCFILGNVSRAIAGTAIMKLSGGTFAKPKLRLAVLKPLLAFGLPYQANALVPAFKSLFVPLVLGSLLATDRVGLITWAIGLASIPVILANNFNQVVFPSLARLAHLQDSQTHLANRSMQLASLGFVFIFGSAATLSYSLVDWLFPLKWQAAKPLLPFAIAATALSTIRILSASAFNASDRPGLRFRLEIFGMLLEYGLAVAGLILLGEIGYLYALVAVHGTLLIASGWALHDVFDVQTRRRIFASMGAAIVSYLIIHELLHVPYIPLQLVLFTLMFFSFAVAFDGKITSDLKWFSRELRERLRVKFGEKSGEEKPL